MSFKLNCVAVVLAISAFISMQSIKGEEPNPLPLYLHCIRNQVAAHGYSEESVLSILIHPPEQIEVRMGTSSLVGHVEARGDRFFINVDGGFPTKGTCIGTVALGESTAAWVSNHNLGRDSFRVVLSHDQDAKTLIETKK
jgi:hypothetical protein